MTTTAATLTPPPQPKAPAARSAIPVPTSRPPSAAAIKRLPLLGLQAGFRQFTVDEYHQMIEAGILKSGEKVELINGYLVNKMPRNPAHDFAILALQLLLFRLVSTNWSVRCQCAVTLAYGEPEPDFAIARGEVRTYATRHPGPPDIALVIEIANSSLAGDRTDKAADYAEAGVPEYWIVNLIDRTVEVYTQPSGPGATPGYNARQDYAADESVPLTLDGATLGAVPVAEILP
ncbi:MAG: Uma2 family endonuclease [Fimbriiglobus sp.]